MSEVSPVRATSFIALLAISMLGCSKPGPGMDAHVNLSAEGGTTLADFACKHSKTGGCEFTLYVEDCPDPKTPSACTRQVVEKFSLEAGESRVVQRLPADVRYCVKPRGSSDEPVCPVVPAPPPLKKPPPQTASIPGGGAGVADVASGWHRPWTLMHNTEA